MRRRTYRHKCKRSCWSLQARTCCKEISRSGNPGHLAILSASCWQTAHITSDHFKHQRDCSDFTHSDSHNTAHMATALALGCGVAACAVSLRWLYRRCRSAHAASLLTGQSIFTHYHKGGFESRMTRREAGLILGVGE